MSSKIRIIKRAVRDLTQGEQETQTLEYSRDKAKVDSHVQMARTIQEWVRERRHSASEELSAARLLKSALS